MSNLIIQTEQVEDYMRRGAPEGTEPLGRAVPVLIARIAELERALIPFARAAAQGNPSNLPLTQVYFRDCETARMKLSRAAALAVLPEPSELAAE
jgi:hypothetical protein